MLPLMAFTSVSILAEIRMGVFCGLTSAAARYPFRRRIARSQTVLSRCH
jgi:hypothetical protein